MTELPPTGHESPSPSRQSPVSSARRRLRFMVRLLGRGLAGFITIYGLTILIGLIPVNNDFRPTENGVEIWVVSNAVHADIVMPLQQADVDWGADLAETKFVGSTRWATHVAIGWGDRGFFLETPTWADLRLSTTLHAIFWPSASCLHVQMLTRHQLPRSARSVRLSTEQYARLAKFVRSSFVTGADGRLKQIASAAYGEQDAFFSAHGHYHCWNTCNSWVGRGLQTAGMRVAWLTPLPKTVFLYWPDQTDLTAKIADPLSEPRRGGSIADPQWPLYAGESERGRGRRQRGT